MFRQDNPINPNLKHINCILMNGGVGVSMSEYATFRCFILLEEKTQKISSLSIDDAYNVLQLTELEKILLK